VVFGAVLDYIPFEDGLRHWRVGGLLRHDSVWQHHQREEIVENERTTTGRLVAVVLSSVVTIEPPRAPSAASPRCRGVPCHILEERIDTDQVWSTSWERYDQT
jgi:hypothetical protein